MKLASQEIKHIANLARLELTDAEFSEYGDQLSDILSYIDQLKEVNTAQTEITAQVTDLENVFREDEVENWDEEEVKEALEEAPQLEDNQIKVKKVL